MPVQLKYPWTIDPAMHCAVHTWNKGALSESLLSIAFCGQELSLLDSEDHQQEEEKEPKALN